MVKFGLMALVSSKHENFEVMNFVEKSQEIVTLDEKQKRSLVNFYRKNPTFIDVLSTHVTNFIDKLGINGGLSKDDIEFIETLPSEKSKVLTAISKAQHKDNGFGKIIKAMSDQGLDTLQNEYCKAVFELIPDQQWGPITLSEKQRKAMKDYQSKECGTLFPALANQIGTIIEELEALHALNSGTFSRIRSKTTSTTKALELWSVIPTVDYGMQRFLDVLVKCDLQNIAFPLIQALNIGAN